jgi:hypothetical protein
VPAVCVAVVPAGWVSGFTTGFGGTGGGGGLAATVDAAELTGGLNAAGFEDCDGTGGGFLPEEFAGTRFVVGWADEVPEVFNAGLFNRDGTGGGIFFPVSDDTAGAVDELALVVRVDGWNAGVLSPFSSVRLFSVPLAFDEADDGKGTAGLVGNEGAVAVCVTRDGDGERTRLVISGALNVRTGWDDRRPL